MRLIFAVLFLVVFTPFQAYSQPALQIIPPVKKVGHYKKTIEQLNNHVNNITSGKFFDNFKYKNNKTGKVVEYKNLPSFEKDLFKLEILESLEKAIRNKQKEWTADLELLNKEDGQKLSPEITDPATYADVAHYKTILVSSYIEFICQYEHISKIFFENHSSKFTKEEAEMYLLRIASMKENK